MRIYAMMTSYELLYILPAKYTPAEIQTMIEKINGVVVAGGGTVTGTHHLGKRKLEYSIAHTRYGEYVLIYFDADTGVMPKLNETLRLSTDFLRHQIVKRDPLITTIPNYTESEERKRPMQEEELTRPKSAPAVQARPQKDAMSAADLDKKIDEILTEEVS